MKVSFGDKGMAQQGQVVAGLNRSSHRKGKCNRTIYVPFSFSSAEKGYSFVIGVQIA